jgi:hypothetical protein
MSDTSHIFDPNDLVDMMVPVQCDVHFIILIDRGGDSKREHKITDDIPTAIHLTTKFFDQVVDPLDKKNWDERDRFIKSISNFAYDMRLRSLRSTFSLGDANISVESRRKRRKT